MSTTTRIILIVAALLVCAVDLLQGIYDHKPLYLVIACLWATVAGMHLAMLLNGAAS